MGRSAGSHRRGRWTRRRFLGAAASAAGLAAAGAAPAPIDTRAAPATGTGGPPAPAPDLPLHGSPYLWTSALPASAPSPAHFPLCVAHPGAVRLIHFHVAGDLRDRIVLGLP